MQITLQDEPLAADILGKRIRERRQSLGKTLAQVAEETDLSRGFLSQVENGQTNLSLSALYRIARATETTASSLLAEGTQPAISVVRADEGDWQPASQSNQEQMARSLLSTPRKEIEAHECIVPAGIRSANAWSHSGEEFLYVLEGHMQIEIDGQAPIELRHGDAIAYCAALPHRWIGIATTTRVLNVIALPVTS